MVYGQRLRRGARLALLVYLGALDAGLLLYALLLVPSPPEPGDWAIALGFAVAFFAVGCATRALHLSSGRRGAALAVGGAGAIVLLFADSALGLQHPWVSSYWAWVHALMILAGGLAADLAIDRPPTPTTRG